MTLSYEEAFKVVREEALNASGDDPKYFTKDRTLGSLGLDSLDVLEFEVQVGERLNLHISEPISDRFVQSSPRNSGKYPDPTLHDIARLVMVLAEYPDASVEDIATKLKAMPDAAVSGDQSRKELRQNSDINISGSDPTRRDRVAPGAQMKLAGLVL